MTGKEIRQLIAEMLDNSTKNGYTWSHMTATELAQDLCDHDDDIAGWDRAQIEYWIGDFLADQNN